jgi:hypothetical protein
LEVQELVAKKLHRGAAKTILWVGHSAILKTHDWIKYFEGRAG